MGTDSQPPRRSTSRSRAPRSSTYSTGRSNQGDCPSSSALFDVGASEFGSAITGVRSAGDNRLRGVSIRHVFGNIRQCSPCVGYIRHLFGKPIRRRSVGLGRRCAIGSGELAQLGAQRDKISCEETWSSVIVTWCCGSPSLVNDHGAGSTSCRRGLVDVVRGAPRAAAGDCARVPRRPVALVVSTCLHRMPAHSTTTLGDLHGKIGTPLPFGFQP